MSSYAPIRISSIRGNLSIPFDVYVKVDKRYILYCRANEAIEGARLDRLRNKRATHVYIHSDQLEAYRSYIAEKINAAYDDSSNLSLDVRTGIILGALQTCAQELIDNVEDPVKYSIAIEGSKRFVKFMDKETEALRSLLSHKNYEFSITHHGVHVAAIACELARYLGYTASMPMQIPAMIIGCLIHDIEHNYNHIDISVPIENLSAPEMRLYNAHGVQGKSRLNDIPFYDPLILDIILHHDTKIDKEPPSPRDKKEKNPLVHVAATANMYDYYVTRYKLSPKDALKKMLIEEVGALPLECLKGLQDVLKKREIL